MQETSESPQHAFFWGGGGAFTKLRKATISFVLSVRPHVTTRLPTEGFLLYFIFENLWKIYRENVRFFQNQTVITGTLHEDQNTFFIISLSVLLRMRNVPVKSCTENQNTHFVINNFFSKIVPFMRYCGKIL